MAEFDANAYYQASASSSYNSNNPQWYDTNAQPQPVAVAAKPISTFVPQAPSFSQEEAEHLGGEMLSGPMTGTLPHQRGKSFSNFPPANSFYSNTGSGSSTSRFGLSTLEGEVPLLMELGIDFYLILEKTRTALLPFNKIDPALMSDGDLAGPFVFCLALGFLLLLAGKLHFGYVFGFGVVGCWAIYMVLNLICPRSAIELHVVFSVLGYALLPIVLLAFVAVFVTLKQGGWLSLALVPPSVLFSTFTATRFFEATLDAREQRYLIAYPVLLFFACFALITVF